MKDLWQELKDEIESSDNREAGEMISIIRAQLTEMERESESYPDFLARQNKDEK